MNTMVDTAVMSQPPGAEVKAILRSLQDAAALDRAEVQQLLQVSLRPIAGAAGPAAFEADLDAGPFSRVEYREPGPGRPQNFRLLLLEVRPGAQLTLGHLRGDLIPEAAAPTFDPRIPPEGTMSFAVSGARQVTRFQFGARSQTLLAVVIEKPISAGGGAHV